MGRPRSSHREAQGMQFWHKVWNEKAARAPLAILAAMLVVSVIWVLSALLKADPPKAEAQQAAVNVVVKGKVDLSKAGSSDPAAGGGPVMVHVQVPELAYQADVEPKPDGSFELPIKIPTQQTNLHYTVDLSQGDKRWNAVAPQSLKTSSTEEVLELPLVSAEPPPEALDRRSHLADSRSDDGAAAERRQERRERLEKFKENRLQRRGRSKGK